jgi:hypothetical protein
MLKFYDVKRVSLVYARTARVNPRNLRHAARPRDGARRMQMDEVGVYDIKDAKIVRESFLYSMGG